MVGGGSTGVTAFCLPDERRPNASRKGFRRKGARGFLFAAVFVRVSRVSRV